MAGRSVSFTTNCSGSSCSSCSDQIEVAVAETEIKRSSGFRVMTFAYDLIDSNLESLAKWLSCNGEVWGVGPTAVFASAAALFLYHELEATIFVAGDHGQVSMLEKTLVSTMVLGMLALMIHLWVCSMRFFQYYLDTLIKDSPSVLLEMTTAGILGSQAEMVPIGPLTRFLKAQQPQIHITMCWFLSLCYADYVRKHYCQRFNMPYLEQWQAELHDRASRGVHRTVEKVNSFVGAVHQRLRGYDPTASQQPPTHLADGHTVRAASLARRARSRGGAGEGATAHSHNETGGKYVCSSSASRARRLLTRLRNSAPISPQLDVRAAVHRSPASAMLAIPYPRTQRSLEELAPWRRMAPLPFNCNQQ